MNFKIRNRLIALSCLLLFIAIGAIFLLNHASQKPFGVILFIGDGMSPSLITATRLYAGGADYRLALEELPHSAITRTYGKDFAVPDAASGATAIATGERVSHQSLAMTAEGKPLPSLLEDATSTGRTVGLVSNGSITGETAAAFYAKTLNPHAEEEIAMQFLKHPCLDIVLGGGTKYFTSPQKELSSDKNKGSALPKSEAPSLEELKKKGYLVATTPEALATIPPWGSSPILALLGKEDLQVSEENPSNTPSLSDLVRTAIEHLQHNRRGYFLVVDAALIAKAASQNHAEDLFHAILQFDQAIATARQYAGSQSLIIVTGPQNIGGMQMNGYPFRNDKGVAVLGINAQGIPSITWSTGPGNHASNNAADSGKENLSVLAEPAAFTTPSAIGIAEDIITLGSGQGSEELSGFINLPSVHNLIKKEL